MKNLFWHSLRPWPISDIWIFVSLDFILTIGSSLCTFYIFVSLSESDIMKIFDVLNMYLDHIMHLFVNNIDKEKQIDSNTTYALLYQKIG